MTENTYPLSNFFKKFASTFPIAFVCTFTDHPVDLIIWSGNKIKIDQLYTSWMGSERNPQSLRFVVLAGDFFLLGQRWSYFFICSFNFFLLTLIKLGFNIFAFMGFYFVYWAYIVLNFVCVFYLKTNDAIFNIYWRVIF